MVYIPPCSKMVLRNMLYTKLGLGGTEIFCLRLLQSSALVIFAIIAMETKYVVKLDLHLNLVHYYGPCSIQMRHSYATTAQCPVLDL